ncbi:tetratricopeptide (TPR) repeat protein [Sphingomonas kyeonggiensis]|uniref:Tetratricopeptide (TPR) repeat protein n=1 Tax=Sphingomonas kyeonggiensis TaxID=1268553 RepID=A0A7W7NSN5_9SPHN|nr:tetratricopeptide repeat protein [Sphingomonas kyeonggiensis]MBB4839087.1 tetratricopeptide (TPR) repeat protein [Sphingomonas kyeonggiensis]
MKLAFALMLAAAPVGPALAQDAAETARNDKLGQAVRLIQGGQPQQAIDLLNPLIVEYQGLYRGEKQKLCQVEDYETAAYASLPGGKDAMLVDGGWCIALWGKGFAMIDLNQLDGAILFLERAVTMAPLHPHYLSELGYAYQAQKQWQRSYDLYARAADAAKRESGERQKKSLRRAWFGMAYDQIELGRLDEAEVLFRKCLELTPDDQKIKDELQYISEQRAKKKAS